MIALTPEVGGHRTGRICPELASPRRAQPDPRPAQVPPDRLPAHPGRFFDAPQRPAKPAQGADLFLFFVLQDVGHPAGRANSPVPVNVPRTPSRLAAFQVATTGRFWVATEVLGIE